MGFLPGIFNRTPVTPAAQPATPVAPGAAQPSGAGPASKQAEPANPAAAPVNMSGATPVQDAGGAAPGTASALDSFKDYFKPKAVDPAAPKPVTLADPYVGNFDEAGMRTNLNNVNFLSGVPQDLVQKATTGDAESLMNLINHASREAFMAGTKMSHGLVEHGAKTAAERVSGSLDSRIRNHQVRTHTIDDATLAHPSVAPMFNMARQTIANANPQLSAAEVHEQAVQYFSAMSEGMMAGKVPQGQQQQPAAPAAPNFASYLPDFPGNSR